MSEMPLSEAMRLGAMSNQQAFGFLVDAFGKTCAMGAALDAIGKIGEMRAGCQKYGLLYITVRTEFPILSVMATHPVRNYETTVERIIQELNDDHKWTREAIADWLTTIEPQTTPERETVSASVNGK